MRLFLWTNLKKPACASKGDVLKNLRLYGISFFYVIRFNLNLIKQKKIYKIQSKPNKNKKIHNLWDFFSRKVTLWYLLQHQTVTIHVVTSSVSISGQNKKEKKGDSGHPYQLTEVFCNMAIWQVFFCFALSLIPNNNAIKVLLPEIDEMKLV